MGANMVEPIKDLDIQEIRPIPVQSKNSSSVSLPPDKIPTFLTVPGMQVRFKMMYGCPNCDWKDTNLCPEKFNTEDKNQELEDWICKERAEYLASFVPVNAPKDLTYRQWRLYFTEYQKVRQMDMEYTRINLMSRKLVEEREEIKEEPTVEGALAYNRHYEEYNKTYDRWMKMNDSLQGEDIAREGLKIRKKEDADSRDLSLQDFQKFMRMGRSKVVDAQIVKEEKKDDDSVLPT